MCSFFQFVLKSNEVSLGPQRTQLVIQSCALIGYSTFHTNNTEKNKHTQKLNIFNLTVQYNHCLAWHVESLASSERAGRVTDRRRERRRETVDWRAVGDRRGRAGGSFTPVWWWWQQVLVPCWVTSIYPLAWGPPGLQIKMLYCSTPYSTVPWGTATWRGCTRVTMHVRCEPTSMTGQASTRSHLWNVTTWRFLCRGLSVSLLTWQ